LIFSIDTMSSWFNYMRENPDDRRFLECFWDTQLQSKERVIELYPEFLHGPCYIFGGWYGVLAKMIEDNRFVSDVNSIDVDAKCEEVGNKYFSSQFVNFITADMKNFSYDKDPDVVINTSTEHVDQETFDSWYNNIPDGTFVIMQGNNLIIPEHIRPFNNLDDFVMRNKCSVTHAEEMELPGPNNTTYKRFTVTGYKE